MWDEWVQMFDGLQDDVGTSMDNGKRVFRILIEGKPGYGKTTLALKIASDWANKKDYISRYQSVFLIHLQDFQVWHTMLMPVDAWQ